MMHKHDALRLKPGDRIAFGRSIWAADTQRADSYDVGTVVHVTPRGGIKVRLRKRDRWVSYHHVVSVRRRAPPVASSSGKPLKPWQIDGL